MINIALDTSGIGKNRSQNHASYKALKRLITADQIMIYIPYVVKREIETQQLAYYLTDYKNLNESLKKFSKIPKSPEVSAIISSLQEQIQSSEVKILEDASNFSTSWINGLNAEIQEIDTDQTLLALEAYFNGTAPLTSIKNREDIPDSFICRSIEKIKNDIGSLTIIADDKKIVKTFEDKEDCVLFNKIDTFIATDEIQEKLKALDIISSKIGNLLQFIERSETSNPTIHNYLSENIGDAIWNESVDGIIYSNDGNQATISSASNGGNISIDFSRPIHYGSDQLGFPFELITEVEIEYFIDKSEYYMNFDHGTENLSVGDWNDHVFEASEYIEVKVSGIISVKISTKNLDLTEISELEEDEFDDYFHDVYREAELNIETIEEINPI